MTLVPLVLRALRGQQDQPAHPLWEPRVNGDTLDGQELLDLPARVANKGFQSPARLGRKVRKGTSAPKARKALLDFRAHKGTSALRGSKENGDFKASVVCKD